MITDTSKPWHLSKPWQLTPLQAMTTDNSPSHDNRMYRFMADNSPSHDNWQLCKPWQLTVKNLLSLSPLSLSIKLFNSHMLQLFSARNVEKLMTFSSGVYDNLQLCLSSLQNIYISSGCPINFQHSFYKTRSPRPQGGLFCLFAICPDLLPHVTCKHSFPNLQWWEFILQDIFT